MENAPMCKPTLQTGLPMTDLIEAVNFELEERGLEEQNEFLFGLYERIQKTRHERSNEHRDASKNLEDYALYLTHGLNNIGNPFNAPSPYKIFPSTHTN